MHEFMVNKMQLGHGYKRHTLPPSQLEHVNRQNRSTFFQPLSYRNSLLNMHATADKNKYLLSSEIF